MHTFKLQDVLIAFNVAVMLGVGDRGGSGCRILGSSYRHVRSPWRQRNPDSRSRAGCREEPCEELEVIIEDLGRCMAFEGQTRNIPATENEVVEVNGEPWGERHR